MGAEYFVTAYYELDDDETEMDVASYLTRFGFTEVYLERES